MKVTKLAILAIAATLITFGISGTTLAFHDGGVARCDGCHTMHNSLDGADDTVAGTIGGDLTKGSDPSSTCLNCHNGGGGGYHVNSTDGTNFTGGGDFYWLTKTFTWTAHGSNYASAGDDHGHNIVAADFGLTPDATLTTAPGGTFNAGSLGCTSCHDPHGKKVGAGAIEVSGSYGADPTLAETGNFRLLGDIGYAAGSGVTFLSAVPTATSFSRNPETDVNHVDYGQDMSEWCANCHGTFSGGQRHPAGNDEHLSNDSIASNYNAYVATGDLSGLQATSLLALVPFERGTNDPTALTTDTTVGPDANSNVMCLSCHRAHASAFQNAGRWDFHTEFIADSHPTATDGGVTGDDVLNSYYGRDMVASMGEFQRGLCNKCHLQD